MLLHFFTQKQETHLTQQYYQLRTKTYYLILLKEKILLKTKILLKKSYEFEITITKTFIVSGSDCSLLKRRQYLKIFGLQSVEETTILHANLWQLIKLE